MNKPETFVLGLIAGALAGFVLCLNMIEPQKQALETSVKQLEAEIRNGN